MITDDPYLFMENAVDRLCREFKEHNGLIVGFDFDDTVYDFHGKGFKYPNVIELLKKAHGMGCTLVCHTGNPDRSLVESHLKDLGIIFQWETPIMFGNKPYFNILLDDRAGLSSAFFVLTATLKTITQERKNES